MAAAKAVLVARESFVCEHEGREVLVRVGTRLPATDKLVKAHREFFATEAELHTVASPGAPVEAA